MSFNDFTLRVFKLPTSAVYKHTHTHTNQYFCVSLSFSRLTNSQSLKHTNQTVWVGGGAVFGLLASPTSMTPGPMPSTSSLAVLEHSGPRQANPGQLSDCFPGARPCASDPLDPLPNPNHWHCLSALKRDPGESTDTGGNCQASDGLHSKLQELT